MLNHKETIYNTSFYKTKIAKAMRYPLTAHSRFLQVLKWRNVWEKDSQ